MGIQTFLFVFAGWMFSLCLHEYSHARLAYEGGDTSVKEKGYLSFNPFRYVDPVYSIVMPMVFLALGGIGLPGGAVWIDRSRIRDPRWMSVVSFAGPFSNCILAVLLAAPFWFVSNPQGGLWPALAFLALLQVTSVLFNLIPVPPLDGFGIVRPFLPPELQVKIDGTAQFGFYLVVGALWFVPQASNFFWGTIAYICSTLGVPVDLAFEGLRLFRFWN